MLRGQLLKGATPLLVLSVLREGEFYGYQIAKRIRELTSNVLAPSEGSLYPALHRLEAMGALQATWRDSDQGPKRRYYRITPAGTRMLAQHQEEWDAFAGGIRVVTGRPAAGS
jgi:PadR family transcriptional regulator, regulatory protein PadR